MRNSVPTKFSKGESLSWEKSFSLYPATDWTLIYYFRGAGTGFDAAATADGTNFLVTIAKTVTAAMTAGNYSFQAFVEKDDEKICVDAGDVIVTQGFASLETSETLDNRSQVKKILDAIDATIEGKASLDQLEYEIGNRRLRRYAMDDLLKLRDTYAKLYAAEIRAEKARKGKSPFKTIKVGFERAK